MIEEYVQKSLSILNEFKRVTPHLIARKFKMDLDFAHRVCQRVWLIQHKEARKAAATLDCDWPAQLDRVKLKNLEKIKRKNVKGK